MAGYRRQLYRDDAVVLRVQKLGESDRIITLLTRRHGRLRAVARGVRRTISKFGARLEPFGHVDLQLAGDPKGNLGSSLHTVSQVEGIDAVRQAVPRRLSPLHGGQRDRRDRRAAHPGRAGAVAAAVPAHPGRAARRCRGASTPPRLVLDAYLLRGMALAGWAPALIACAVCGTPGRHRAFSVPAGGAVCPDCRPPGAAHPAPATIDLMSALTSGDWRVADATETGGPPGVQRPGRGAPAVAPGARATLAAAGRPGSLGRRHGPAAGRCRGRGAPAAR